MRTTSLALLRPSTWKPAVAAARSLWFDYAHLNTVLSRSSVDAARQPVPWYTYPAIEYVKQLDFSEKDIFEYGSGNSTLFWASVGKRVVSVEDDEEWYEKVKKEIPSKCELILQTDLARYVETINAYPAGFDVIVVDGAARGGTRRKCARVALNCLRPGGMIILDNSDWLPESARILREEGNLIQVDMTGFAPIAGNTQTTSFFLHREFRFAPRGPRQPLPGPGAAPKMWEGPRCTRPPVVEVDGETFGSVQRDETFTIDSPTGPRRFRLIVCGESEGDAVTTAALFDVDRQRVLVSPATEAELLPSARMSWQSFCQFVDRHPKRRYRLDSSPSEAGVR